MEVLDELAYHKRELFEYWGHAACLLPISLYPLLRYRMRADAARDYLRSEQGRYTAQAYAEVAERGPLSAGELSEPGKRTGNWWGWASGKAALEYLYDSGLLSIAGRRGFERLYDLTERVIPSAALNAPSPPREEAMKQLILLAAKALGVATSVDLAWYFQIDGWRDRALVRPRSENGPAGRAKPIARRLISELVEEGRLVVTSVEDWSEQAFVLPETQIPKVADARALMTPFDSLLWERKRVERLFGMKYVLELYVPKSRRQFGYYVFAFLMGDTLAARCDLKADRQRGALMVQSAFLEPRHDPRRVAAELLCELREMQRWLQLDRIEVGDHGDLAPYLKD
jgi:uncharacterized protein YcaQ